MDWRIGSRWTSTDAKMHRQLLKDENSVMLWFCLILFCAAFTATVLATPWVISLARRIRAIDQPDGFRKTQHGSTPRMGGIGVALGIFVAMAIGVACKMGIENTFWELDYHGLPTVIGLFVILAIGILDDQRDLGAMTKLGGQAFVACLFYFDGFRIDKVFVFGHTIDLHMLAPAATCFWFLACMNVWNLIDGMDGLASGVAMLVSATLLVASLSLGHVDVALAAAGLAGALAGFLMYNFHPAKIFLGDTGSLLIGSLLGLFAIKGSLKSGMTVAILVPILAMGLPIVDTALAIVRRWIRHVPWNAADNGHLHHRLMAYGLTQRQASLFLYSFTVLLCASSLASIALQSDSLALVIATLGTLALGVVFMARREDCASFFEDFRQRLNHRRLEQKSAKIVWEGIQRLAHCQTIGKLVQSAEDLATKLSCRTVSVTCERSGKLIISHEADIACKAPVTSLANHGCMNLQFEIADQPGNKLTVAFAQENSREIPISFGARFFQRYVRELNERIGQLHDEETVGAMDFGANEESAEREEIAAMESAAAEFGTVTTASNAALEFFKRSFRKAWKPA